MKYTLAAVTLALSPSAIADITCDEAARFFQNLNVQSLPIFELPDDKQFWVSKFESCKEQAEDKRTWEIIETNYSIDWALQNLTEKKQQVLDKDKQIVSNFKARIEGRVKDIASKSGYEPKLVEKIEVIEKHIHDHTEKAPSYSYKLPETSKWLEELNSYKANTLKTLDGFKTNLLKLKEKESAAHIQKLKEQLSAAKTDFNNASSSQELMDAYSKAESYQSQLRSTRHGYDAIYSQLNSEQKETQDEIDESYSELLSDYKDRMKVLEKKEAEKATKELKREKAREQQEQQQKAQAINQSSPVQDAIKYLNSGSANPMPVSEKLVMGYLQSMESRASQFSMAQLQNTNTTDEKREMLAAYLINPMEEMGYNFDDSLKYAAVKFLTKDYNAQEAPLIASFSFIPMQARDTLMALGLISENTHQLLQMLSET